MPAGSEQRDERDVRGARGDERGEQSAAGEILGVGNLEREDDSGERRTEDGGDARRRRLPPSAPWRRLGGTAA